jgi:hypothetical protein
MVAITSVEIENFRCFRKLRVDGLAQVNLIVGANNAGKTVLLEAVEAVVSRDNPYVLYRASLERNEYRQRRGAVEDVVEIDLRHWFHGHALSPGVAFQIRAASDYDLATSWRMETVSADVTIPQYVPGGLHLIQEQQSTRERPEVSGKSSSPLTADGWLSTMTPLVPGLHRFGLLLHPPVGFVPTNRLVSGQLASLWMKIELTPAEQRAVDALRLIEPQIDRIAISESDGAKVLLRGATSFLLIDEIENGLHWSVMPKIWRFLVEAAVVNRTQIFAATHSKDWLEGLADLHRTNPELAAHVAVHRLQRGRESSIWFDAGRIAEYVEMELEAR